MKRTERFVIYTTLVALGASNVVFLLSSTGKTAFAEAANWLDSLGPAESLKLVDGDKELRVAITVRNGAGGEIGRTDLMEHTATSGNFGPGTTGMTLQQAVFAGLVDPGNLVNVREITDNVPQAGDCAAPTPTNCDTAVFAGPRAQYTITNNANGSVTVSDTTSAPPAVGVVATGDGTDTLWNIEKLQFSDSATQLGTPSAPAIGAATAGNTTAALNWSLPVTNGGSPVTGFQVDVRTGTTVVRTVAVTPGTATSAVITGLTNGTAYNFMVRAVNASGASPNSGASNTVTPATTPSAPRAAAARSRRYRHRRSGQPRPVMHRRP